MTAANRMKYVPKEDERQVEQFRSQIEIYRSIFLYPLHKISELFSKTKSAIPLWSKVTCHINGRIQLLPI